MIDPRVEVIYHWFLKIGKSRFIQSNDKKYIFIKKAISIFGPINPSNINSVFKWAVEDLKNDKPKN